MKAERIRYHILKHTEKGIRALLVPLLIPAIQALASDSPPSLRNFKTALAGELQNFQEQQTDWMAEIVANLAKIFEGKDLGKIKANLDGRYMSWIAYGDNYPVSGRSIESMMSLFKQSFDRRGTPRCAGYMQSGPNGKYLGVLFENFGALNNTSGYSLVELGVDPRVMSQEDPLRSRRIVGVKEVLKSQLDEVEGNVQPCKPKISAEPKIEQAKETSTKSETAKAVPADVKGKIVYVSDKSGERKIYSANPDLSDEKILVEGDAGLGNPRWLPDGKRFVYYSISGDETKRGVYVFDTKTGQAKKLTSPDKANVDYCATPDGEDVIFSRFEVFLNKNASENIYKIANGSLELLTNEELGSSEHCPTVSPDGKYIAFRVVTPGQPGMPNGIAIYPRENFKQDFNPRKHPVFFEGAEVSSWSPDSQWLLFAKEIELGPPRGYTYNLYKIRPDGTDETLIAKDSTGGSFSQDGKYIIFSSKKDNDQNLDLYLVPTFDGETMRLTNSLYNEFVPNWQPEVQEALKDWQRSLLVVFGLITEIKNGHETHNLTDEFERWMEEEYGFEKPDISRMSWGGWTVGPSGEIVPKDQDCTDTLTSPDKRADMLIQLLNEREKSQPNRKTTIITQSEGAIPTLLALDKVRKGEAKVNLKKIEKIIIVSGPVHGVDKPILDKLGALWPVEQPENCRILFGATPPPSILDYPTGQNLLDLWDNRERRDKELSELTRWLRSYGIEVYSLYNFEDCVIAHRICAIPSREVLEILLEKGRLFDVIRTQEIPGAVNIGRFLGKQGWGHDRYWHSEEGLAILTTVVGSQKKK